MTSHSEVHRPTRFSERQDVFFSHAHLTGSAWSDPIRDPFEERVAAVGSVGAGMGMAITELDDLLTTHTPDGLRGVLDHHGVQIGELEILLGWAGDTESGRALEKSLYRYAEMFGATRAKAIAVADPATALPPLDVLAGRFAALCDRAADHGLTVAVEPVAFLPRFDYALAADMVMAADRPNGGLLFDTWQTFRDPTGIAALNKVAARHITHVELADGYAAPQGSIKDDCFHGRLLPGEGDFDLVGFIRVLNAKGVYLDPSIEVLSSKLRALTPQENVEVSRATLQDTLTTANSI